MKVLIVDDEPNILMSLDFLMRKEGYEVFIARDGSEAMAIVDSEKPEIVVLDIMMPKVDGYQVCEYIKKKSNYDMRVIFLSAKTKEEDIKKAYEIGADLFLTKPFSPRNLIRNIKEIANKVAMKK